MHDTGENRAQPMCAVALASRPRPRSATSVRFEPHATRARAAHSLSLLDCSRLGGSALDFKRSQDTKRDATYFTFDFIPERGGAGGLWLHLLLEPPALSPLGEKRPLGSLPRSGGAWGSGLKR